MASLLLLLADAQGTAPVQSYPASNALALGGGAPPAAPTAPEAKDEPSSRPGEVARAAGDQAARTLAGLRGLALRNLPKLALVVALLATAWLLGRLLRAALRRLLGTWPRATAATALGGLTIWTLAIAISVTVVAGDIRAFLGSVGLLGLAASWALQTPIESFTGWLLNAFRGYYRVGDRVEVDDVFGDVHRIDVLTTTVWEIGSPFRPGFVRAEQATGRLITFPNSQVLTGSIMNLTRDVEFVWDELAVAIANESALRYAVGVLEKAARDLLGSSMADAAARYESILQRGGLAQAVARTPEVFVSAEESWMGLHIRYLVPARERRTIKSQLVLHCAEVLNRPEHAGRIIPVLPRRQLQFVDAEGRPRNAAWFEATSNAEPS